MYVQLYTFTFVISQPLACTHYCKPWTSGTKFQISYHVLVTDSKPFKSSCPCVTIGLVVAQPRPNQTLRQRFHHTVGAVSTQYGAVPWPITVTQIILGGGK